MALLISVPYETKRMIFNHCSKFDMKMKELEAEPQCPNLKKNSMALQHRPCV